MTGRIDFADLRFPRLNEIAISFWREGEMPPLCYMFRLDILANGKPESPTLVLLQFPSWQGSSRETRESNFALVTSSSWRSSWQWNKESSFYSCHIPVLTPFLTRKHGDHFLLLLHVPFWWENNGLFIQSYYNSRSDGTSNEKTGNFLKDPKSTRNTSKTHSQSFKLKTDYKNNNWIWPN
jgi:hypothetical protein